MVSVCERLQGAFPTASLFCIDGFVGASPETLIAKKGQLVSAHPLAGTEPRTGDKGIDAEVVEALLSSTKDQYEHRVTISWLLDELRPYCSFVDAEPEPTIVSLANVFHLGTKVEGQLSDANTHVLDLVSLLHPTPAVGGDPQAEALNLIAELEPDSRGRYAGPVGWFQGGDGEFAVGIRSAEVSDDRTTLYAGVGVVQGSDPEKEWLETEAKFEAMKIGLGIS